MTDKDARLLADARVNSLIHRAVAERLWLTAAFFFIFRGKAVAAELESHKVKSAPREKSPFIYDMR